MNHSLICNAPRLHSRHLFADTTASAVLVLLAACGGATEDESASTVASAASPLAVAESGEVMLAGCVVDKFYIPRPGAQIRIRYSDGRLLGDLTSDSQGEFTVAAPANKVLSIAVDHQDGDAMTVYSGHDDRRIEGCLRDLEISDASTS